MMGVSRRILAITKLKDLADLDGYLLYGCYDCKGSDFVSALGLLGKHGPDTKLCDLIIRCPKCKRALSGTPLVTPYDWVVAKLLQRELPL